jgi:tRNA pseudouridine13 synthase
MYRDFSFDFNKIGVKSKLFPYSTKGFIKDSTKDFIVEEEGLQKENKEGGKYTYFTLVKDNWTTMQALNRIARYCHVSWKRFRFAGTKDKHAITKQLVSVRGVNPEVLKKVKIKDLTITDVFQSDEELELGDLKGNNFNIRVNDYECRNIKKVLSSFKKFIKNGIPNYFAEQRFGIQRTNNHLIGRLILNEDYEEALKELLAKSYPLEGEDSRKARDFLFNNWKRWKEALPLFPKYLNVERVMLNHLVKHPNDYVNSLRKLPRNIAKIFVYSYQSYIFNLSISKMIKRGLLTDFELELPGYNSKLKKMGGSIVEEVMDEEGVELSDFQVSSYPEISCRGTTRRTIVFPENFKVLNISKKSYVVSFSLPKGSYATLVLRELIQ